MLQNEERFERVIVIIFNVTQTGQTRESGIESDTDVSRALILMFSHRRIEIERHSSSEDQ